MERKLPFRLPSRTAWRSAASAALAGFLAALLAQGGGGFGAFLALSAGLYGFALAAAGFRGIGRALFALAIVCGGALAAAPSALPPLLFGAIVAGLAFPLYFLAGSPGESRRIAGALFGVGFAFVAAFVLFSRNPAAGGALSPALAFLGFGAAIGFAASDDARQWDVLRVGKGKLVGAAVGLVALELAAILALLPLGAVRAAALVAITLFLVREGLRAAYRGEFRRPIAFTGLAVFYALAVLIFASVPWAP